TLCSKDHPLLLEDISAYSPVISRALEPANAEEAKKLDDALKNYLLEDPTLKLELDEDTGLRILSGMGELHLDVLLERLEREYGLKPRSGEPRVVFLETITQPASGRAEIEREVAGVQHQGMVSLEVEPLPRSHGVQVDFALPEEERAAEKTKIKNQLSAAANNARAVIGLAIESALTSGPLEGYAVGDVKVSVTGYEAKSDAGLNMAAAQALRDALLEGAPALLEPIMKLEIVTPGESVGDVLNLLAALNARVLDVSAGEHVETISAEAPMRGLFGFATSLRSVSKGRAGMTLSFDRFDIA
ncbi:MAG: elongation factor G, partial [Desulfovibrionaceae bacterium]|nr:elongation factor G [Desulfovibrionaceae bacterium]